MTRILEDIKLDFKDVLILPKRSKISSRKEVILEKEYKLKNSTSIYKGIPIMIANMDKVATINMALEVGKFGLFTALNKHQSLPDLLDFFSNTETKTIAIENTAYSMGITQEDLQKFGEFKTKVPEIKYVMIDVANGYSQSFIDFCSRFKEKNPNQVLIAGNVCTPEIVEELILNSGVSIVKIGIGSGSSCSTRLKAGVGYPQLSAILECADAAHGHNGHIISDGGVNYSCDFAKAFAAGADFVMSGGFFSGHEEGGNTPDSNGNCIFYGMSSKKAQEAHGSSLKEYRASEGRVLQVPYKGKVEDTIQDILGSLRSTCSYVGAASLKELPKRTTFVRVSQQISTPYGVGQL